MYDLKVRRLTGAFGLAIVALNWAMFPLYIVPGPAPQFQDTAKFIDYWTSINGIVLTRVFLDILECACLLVFAAGLRHLIRQARSDGQALDMAAGPVNPTAIRALGEGYILIYQSIGCILIALFSAAAGYATLGTGVLPKWTGRMAYAAAVLNLVAVPLGLSIAPAAVLAVAVIADFPLQIWLLIVSILMIRKREAVALREQEATIHNYKASSHIV
jgi:hypothetical protein